MQQDTFEVVIKTTNPRSTGIFNQKCKKRTVYGKSNYQKELLEPRSIHPKLTEQYSILALSILLHHPAKHKTEVVPAQTLGINTTSYTSTNKNPSTHTCANTTSRSGAQIPGARSSPVGTINTRTRQPYKPHHPNTHEIAHLRMQHLQIAHARYLPHGTVHSIQETPRPKATIPSHPRTTDPGIPAPKPTNTIGNSRAKCDVQQKAASTMISW